MTLSDQELSDLQTKPQDWFFTFGSSHGYENCYVKITGTIISSRKHMNNLFGSKWAFQYPSAEAAGVRKWNLKELDLNDLPHLRRNE